VKAVPAEGVRATLTDDAIAGEGIVGPVEATTEAAGRTLLDIGSTGRRARIHVVAQDSSVAGGRQ
jgi:hypothetical protein